jgi:hypothetical protein
VVTDQSDDEMAVVQALIVRSEAVAAFRLVHPTLRMLSPRPGVDGAAPQLFLLNVPLCTMALQSHTMLALDHHTHVFVWVGGDVSTLGVFVSRCALCGGINVPFVAGLVMECGSLRRHVCRTRAVPTAVCGQAAAGV